MADFCNQCSEKLFGKITAEEVDADPLLYLAAAHAGGGDLAGIVTPEEVDKGSFGPCLKTLSELGSST